MNHFPTPCTKVVHLAWVHTEGVCPAWVHIEGNARPGYTLRGETLAWVHTKRSELGLGSHFWRGVNLSWVHTARIELGLGSH